MIRNTYWEEQCSLSAIFGSFSTCFSKDDRFGRQNISNVIGYLNNSIIRINTYIFTPTTWIYLFSLSTLETWQIMQISSHSDSSK